MFSQGKHNIHDSLASETLLYLLIKFFIVHVMSVFSFKDVFIFGCWVFVAACGLPLVAVNWVSSLVEVPRLLIAVASLAVGHKLQVHGLQ